MRELIKWKINKELTRYDIEPKLYSTKDFLIQMYVTVVVENRRLVK